MAEPITLGGAPNTNDPSQKSSEYRLMEKDWERISDILAGVTAIRAKGEAYLPKYQDESPEEYARRKMCAPWRPEFEDCLRSLASKPFGKEVMFRGELDDIIAGTLDNETKMRRGGITDDVDGRGNNQTVFARGLFYRAIAMGMEVILVDYPSLNPSGEEIITLAMERSSGVRPYWVRIAASEIIALYFDLVGSHEVPVHFRFRETATIRDGFGERTVERIRVMEPGRWELWEKQSAAEFGGAAIKWIKVDEGIIRRGPSGLTGIPIVPYFTGERDGPGAVRIPVNQLAQMQIELYQALSREEEILTFAGSPMLTANGIAKPDGDGPSVGPKVVLYAPPGIGGSGNTSWAYIQPDAANITAINSNVRSIIDDMRRLGMQPMMPRTGTQTATGQSIDAAKAHSTVKAWALQLNDALEQAWKFTTEWLGLPDTVQTVVSTDWSAEQYSQPALTALQAARAGKDISRDAYLDGLKRFGVLNDDFDPEEDELKLAEEGDTAEDEEPIDPRNGQPLTAVDDVTDDETA